MLLPAARGDLKELGSDAIENLELLNAGDLSVDVSSVSEAQRGTVAVSTAMVDFARDLKFWGRILGVVAAVLAAAIVLPVLTVAVARWTGSTIPELSVSLYLCSAVTSLILGIIFAFLVALWRFHELSGNESPRSNRRRMFQRTLGSVLPLCGFLLLVALAWGLLIGLYPGSPAPLPVATVWGFAWAIAGISSPLMALVVTGGIPIGALVAEFRAPVSCWDVLVVDLLDLAAAVRFLEGNLRLSEVSEIY